MPAETLEELRDKARELCAAHGIAVLPYGRAWWLIGEGISRVVGELAGLTAGDLAPLPMADR